jgi:hypothetical protein
MKTQEVATGSFEFVMKNKITAFDKIIVKNDFMFERQFLEFNKREKLSCDYLIEKSFSDCDRNLITIIFEIVFKI